jgi:hypothetical protein
LLPPARRARICRPAYLDRPDPTLAELSRPSPPSYITAHWLELPGHKLVTMSHETEKHLEKEAVSSNGYHHDGVHDEEVGIVNKSTPLSRELKGRHMQMIAIGTLSPHRAVYTSFAIDSALQVVPSAQVSSSALVAPCAPVARLPWFSAT